MGLLTIGGGGTVSGGSTSTSNQTATVSFLPTVNDYGDPIFSPYPAGQGLSTINEALPGSAAVGTASNAGTPATTTDATTYLILAAAALAAWWLFKGKL